MSPPFMGNGGGAPTHRETGNDSRIVDGGPGRHVAQYLPQDPVPQVLCCLHITLLLLTPVP